MPVKLSHPKWPGLFETLSGLGATIVAVSGGVDSLLLATLAHRVLPGRAVMAHALSPAVPRECTERVKAEAHSQGWRLVLVSSGEFNDENYLSNPYDRCYFCKSHLYSLLTEMTRGLRSEFEANVTVVSGANTGDLGEHRPGLEAAREKDVRHPFVEAGIAKQDIRAMARELGLSFADIPASPCLASRVYTGTRVTPELLGAVSFAENTLRSLLRVDVLRCRVRQDSMLVEMLPEQRHLASPDALSGLQSLLKERFPGIANLELDPEGYRPGRAFRRETQ